MLSMILGAVEDVKASMVHVTAKIDGLDQKYLPRAEYEARHSDLRNTVTQLDGRLQAEGKEREKLEEKLTSSRRFGLTTSIAGLVAVIALLTFMLATLHH